MCTLTGHTGVVDQVAFSDDGAQAISGSYDNTVRGAGTRERVKAACWGWCASVPGMAEKG